jgi:hypothetical protein
MLRPNELTTKELAELLNNADVIETWIKGVRDYATQRLKFQEKIPGWTLKTGLGNRSWKDAAMAKEALAQAGVKNIIVEELVSPTQAERLLKAQKIQLDLFEWVERKETGAKLVRDSDSGSATANAAIDFAD